MQVLRVMAHRDCWRKPRTRERHKTFWEGSPPWKPSETVVSSHWSPRLLSYRSEVLPSHSLLPPRPTPNSLLLLQIWAPFLRLQPLCDFCGLLFMAFKALCDQPLIPQHHLPLVPASDLMLVSVLYAMLFLYLHPLLAVWTWAKCLIVLWLLIYKWGWQ